MTNIIERAKAAVGAAYFQLAIDGGDPIYRERVYCYELYHQMRLVWPGGTEYCLNGEIDKAAHPILKQMGASHAKPDILIHKPGYMTGNHAIIEVKSSNAGAVGVKKDLDTLSLFKGKVGYQRAIYLIYGYESAAAAERVMNTANRLPDLERIELWLHETPGKPAKCARLLPSHPKKLAIG